MMSFLTTPYSKSEQIGSVPESSSKTKEYSLDEWELQRGHITNLYVTHQKSLPQVMELMESQFGFVASQRQYKRRFAKWGLDTKNIRDHDMRLVLVKDLKRKRQGKDTEFEINGRRLPRQKMQRFVVRKELSEADLIQPDAPTPPYITYHTPRPGEDDGITHTLASISLGKDEVMTDTCATHDEGTEKLFNHSNSIGQDRQHENSTSVLASLSSPSDKGSEDTSKILARNEAWLQKRGRARNDLGLVLAYARLIWIGKNQIWNPHKHFLMWKSYFERRLETYNSDPYRKIWTTVPLPDRSFLLYIIHQTFGTLETSLSDYWLFHGDSEPNTSLNSTIDLQQIPAASPFERWSQRYDISSSPNWIRSYMSPSNPLLLLTPAPLGSPWDLAPKPSPRLTGSPWRGSKMVDRYSHFVDDSTFLISNPQVEFEDLALGEPKLYSDFEVQSWEPTEDFVLVPTKDARSMWSILWTSSDFQRFFDGEVVPKTR